MVLEYACVSGLTQKIKQRAQQIELRAAKSTIEVSLCVSAQELYLFTSKVCLRIVINSKNEAARFKHAAQPWKKYHESMTAGNYTGTVLLQSMELYNDQIEK